jgi:hypothetical protein
MAMYISTLTLFYVNISLEGYSTVLSFIAITVEHVSVASENHISKQY